MFQAKGGTCGGPRRGMCLKQSLRNHVERVCLSFQAHEQGQRALQEHTDQIERVETKGPEPSTCVQAANLGISVGEKAGHVGKAVKRLYSKLWRGGRSQCT